MLLGCVVAVLSCGCGAAPARDAPRKRARRAAPPKAPPEAPAKRAEEVCFSVDDAPLRGEVLPIFARQAGVSIRWDGPEKRVRLRLVRPVHWTVALDLICRSAGVHLARDYRGKFVLKSGYGGSLGSDEDVAALLEAQRQGGRRSSARRRSGAGSVAPDPGGGYRETTRNARGSRSYEGYNSGNRPTELFDRIR
ncbi:MAG: hypothetical protein D6731_03445 [Planctomycetota bacterium]|nr:MAG: hypothetical protein D6731_03445 [Planctomycetota bacterium]